LADQNSSNLLSPRLDFVFKNLFGDDRSLGALKSFLFAVLNVRENELDEIIVEDFSDLSSDKLSEPVADESNSISNKDFNSIFITDPLLKKEFSADKFGILDVKVKTKEGKTFHIEMQSVTVPCMIQRIIYYHSKLLSQQLISGDNYDLLKTVVSIVVTDFIFIGDKFSPVYHHRFLYHDPDHNVIFSNISEIHALELPRVPATSDNTKLWPWMTFLNATTDEVMKMVGQMDPGIEIARKRLIELSADQKTRRMAEAREKQLHDISSFYAKGRNEGIIYTARKLLWLKIPIDKIALGTGLTEAEIEKLTPLDPNHL
ncbi:MAG: Rpn family recombination-promoting nuclease/putative transposase, partial [Deltaproteobacteria bacterium]|jgi:predicted transposase/invertase (TIGR01784 family)|nr:Rpn family recombination-promoting nuclease/putative transposase [Deltaproteobacteria bacterium]